jgi:hypothetical protein
MPSVEPNGVALSSAPTKALLEAGGLIQAVDLETEVATPGIDPATVAYTPTTPGDWPENPDPTEVENAIDLLAARTLTVENNQLITDTQATSTSVIAATTSTTFVDMPGMTLTTDNDGSATYIFWFNSQYEINTPNKTIHFRLLVDGVVVPDSERDIEISSSNSPSYGGTAAWQAGIGDGLVVKVQWRVSSGTGSVSGRTLIMQGSE